MFIELNKIEELQELSGLFKKKIADKFKSKKLENKQWKVRRRIFFVVASRFDLFNLVFFTLNISETIRNLAVICVQVF